MLDVDITLLLARGSPQLEVLDLILSICKNEERWQI